MCSLEQPTRISSVDKFLEDENYYGGSYVSVVQKSHLDLLLFKDGVMVETITRQVLNCIHSSLNLLKIRPTTSMEA